MTFPLLRGFKLAMRPPDRSLPWVWGEKHVVVDQTSPRPGRWSSSYSPWVRKPMEAAQQPGVRRIVVRCSAQSAKTQMVLTLACWVISEEPGPSLWLMAARDEAREFMRDRALPTFRACRPVREQLADVQGMTILFHGMPFYFAGAGSKSKVQSKPCRYIYLDECRNYPKGRLPMVLKRTRSFPNAKEFLISTPDTAGDDIDVEWMAGTREEWNARCPKCGHLQPLDFFRLTWDKDEAKKPREEFNPEKLADSIRFPCAKCDHVWRDNTIDRRQIRDCGEYVATNPNAPKDVRSFCWNSLLPTWVEWRSVVFEFLKAYAALRNGNPEPYKVFINETLGLSWEDALGALDDFGFLEERAEDYDFGATFPEELYRYMSVDRQEKGGEHYWWLIRAFGPNGHSRLIAYGKAMTLEECEEIRNKFGVKSGNTMLDTGHKAAECYRWCQRMGWKAFKGDRVDFYTVTVEGEDGKSKSIRRIWERREVDPSFGTKRDRGPVRRIPLFRFSSDTAKDYLAEFMLGLVGRWTIPKNVGKEYLRQITAERREAKEDKRGGTYYEWVRKRDNHLLDCELMILIAAIASKVIHQGAVRAPKHVPGV